ncbi:Pentatricopeptide repeat-containing protein 2, mitochondrial [Apodemus speciosus]|uniref:Pentatricopeptide repeat-containing protein 2, mitochondrial n=1 Tax=Apodemus speciosus TaxID=105296 RepID=A0ABQ0FH22_APOSI
MATVFRPLERLRAPRPSLLPGVTGSGSACCRCTLGAKRYLLTDNIVKLKEFQHKKMAIAYNLSGTKEIYFRNLEEKLTQNKLILKEELKTLLHLCQSSEDVQLAKEVIYRYHAENRNFTLGEYKFGPVFMRLCYELDLEDSAMQLIRDKNLQGFFLDSTSFNILMDMLFTKGKYESALQVLIEMKNQNVRFSKDTYVLAFAVCYKLSTCLPGACGSQKRLSDLQELDLQNTPESLKICTTLREEALIKGDIISRRASCFAVALALNQSFLSRNRLEKAMSIFSQIMNPESIACTNLNESNSGWCIEHLCCVIHSAAPTAAMSLSLPIGKKVFAGILIHIQSNMSEGLIKILEDALDTKLSKFVRRHTFSEEVLAKARDKLKDSPTLTARFDEVYGRLHINSQITTYTLDALLCHVPRDRRSTTLLVKKRTVSHRTLQPLSQSLLTE